MRGIEKKVIQYARYEITIMRVTNSRDVLRNVQHGERKDAMRCDAMRCDANTRREEGVNQKASGKRQRGGPFCPANKEKKEGREEGREESAVPWGS